MNYNQITEALIHKGDKMPFSTNEKEPLLFSIGELLVISKNPFQKKVSDDDKESTEPEDDKTGDLMHIIWDQNNIRAF